MSGQVVMWRPSATRCQPSTMALLACSALACCGQGVRVVDESGPARSDNSSHLYEAILQEALPSKFERDLLKWKWGTRSNDKVQFGGRGCTEQDLVDPSGRLSLASVVAKVKLQGLLLDRQEPQEATQEGPTVCAWTLAMTHPEEGTVYYDAEGETTFQILDNNPQLDDGIRIIGSTVAKTYQGPNFGALASLALRWLLSVDSEKLLEDPDFGSMASQALRWLVSEDYKNSHEEMPLGVLERMPGASKNLEEIMALNYFFAQTDYPGCWRMDMFNCIAKVEDSGQVVATILSSR